MLLELFVLQDVDVVEDLVAVAVDMDVALVGEPDALEEATQAVVPRIMVIKVIKVADIPDILLDILKVVVKSVLTKETTMVRLLDVSEPTMVVTSMEEDIVLHSILLVVAEVMPFAIAILAELELEVVLFMSISIMFKKVMATLLMLLVETVMISRSLSLKDIVMKIILGNPMFSLMITAILMKMRWIFKRSIMEITDYLLGSFEDGEIPQLGEEMVIIL